MLVVAAFVSEATQLGAIVAVGTFYIEHLFLVIAVHDPVAADAPVLLVVAHLEFTCVQAVTYNTPLERISTSIVRFSSGASILRGLGEQSATF